MGVTMSTSDENNIVIGSDSTDKINTGDGDDIVLAGEGDDKINAGDGNDTVDAGAGDDTVHAGDGDDILVHNMTENIGHHDTYYGNEGVDTLNLILTEEQLSTATIQDAIVAFMDPARNTNQLFKFSDYDANLNLDVKHIENLLINGKHVIVGTPGDDIIVDTADAEVIIALDGNDTIYSSGADDIYAGAGDDVIHLTDTEATVQGGEGVDTLSFANATEGVNVILGAEDSDLNLLRAGTVGTFIGADAGEGLDLEGDIEAINWGGRIDFNTGELIEAPSVLVGDLLFVNPFDPNLPQPEPDPDAPVLYVNIYDWRDYLYVAPTAVAVDSAADAALNEVLLTAAEFLYPGVEDLAFDVEAGYTYQVQLLLPVLPLDLFGDAQNLTITIEGEEVLTDFSQAGPADLFYTSPEGIVITLTADVIDSQLNISILDDFEYLGPLVAAMTIEKLGAIETPEAEPAQFDGIETLIGSVYDDVLTGDHNANTIIGNGGVDTINGRGGNDLIKLDAIGSSVDGGEGFDTLSYADAAAGIELSLIPTESTAIILGSSVGTYVGADEGEGLDLTGSFAYAVNFGGSWDPFNFLGGSSDPVPAQSYQVGDALFTDFALQLENGINVDENTYFYADAFLPGFITQDGTIWPEETLDDQNLTAIHQDFYNFLWGPTTITFDVEVGHEYQIQFLYNELALADAGFPPQDLRISVEGTEVLDFTQESGGLFGDSDNGIVVTINMVTTDNQLSIELIDLIDIWGHIISGLTIEDLGISEAEATNPTYTSIEKLVGTAHDDVLEGADLSTHIDGGDGVDWLSFEHFAEDVFSDGVNISLDGFDIDPDILAVFLSGGLEPNIDPLQYQNLENIKGTLADDLLIGDDADNIIDGNGGSDILLGLGGDDILIAANSFERVSLVGGEGNDHLIAGFGNDWMQGGDGDDILEGGFGEDIYFASNGHDVIVGEFDANLLSFENVEFDGTVSDVHVISNDFLDVYMAAQARVGTDFLPVADTYEGPVTAINIDGLDMDASDLALGSGVLDMGLATNGALTGTLEYSHIEGTILSNANDMVVVEDIYLIDPNHNPGVSTAEGVFLDGAGGNDVLVGGHGNDVIFGGTGSTGATVTDDLGALVFVKFVNEFNVISAGAGDDHINMGLNGGELFGVSEEFPLGVGDFYTANLGSFDIPVYNLVYAGVGDDVVNAACSNLGLNVAYLGEGNDTFNDFCPACNNIVYAGLGNDTFTSTSFSNIQEFYGEEGDDAIVARHIGVNDIMSGGVGNDTAQNLVLDSSAGLLVSDAINMEGGLLDMGDGNDQALVEYSGGTIDMGDGDDILSISLDTNVVGEGIMMGQGDDLVMLNNAASLIFATTIDGGDGNDTLSLENSMKGVTVSLASIEVLQKTGAASAEYIEQHTYSNIDGLDLVGANYAVNLGLVIDPITFEYSTTPTVQLGDVTFLSLENLGIGSSYDFSGWDTSVPVGLDQPVLDDPALTEIHNTVNDISVDFGSPVSLALPVLEGHEYQIQLMFTLQSVELAQIYGTDPIIDLYVEFEGINTPALDLTYASYQGPSGDIPEALVATYLVTPEDDDIDFTIAGYDSGIALLAGIIVEDIGLAETTGDTELVQLDAINTTGIENLVGSNFKDILAGDTGDNILTGLAGADTFAFDLDSGNDTIADFTVDEDLIDLHLYGVDAATVLAAAANDGFGNAVIDLAALGGTAGDTITLAGVDAALLDEDDFLV